MSELIKIDGIGSNEAELLAATGWSGVHALARADVDVLLREMNAANEMLRIVPRVPERKKVERWIAAAGRLLSPETEGVPTKKSKVSANATASPARPRRATSTGFKDKRAVPVKQPQDVETAVPAEDAGEAQLKALSGPVNFELEPDVVEMLAVAPFALPIPARMLAERGIPPSEIAVAPVLNRACGDMKIRVMVEKPPIKDAPAVPSISRRSPASGAVQVADLGFTVGRRGFDTSKVRTVEEAKADPPPVRAAPTKPGIEDARISLLRSPRPETNAGRNPGSRFYIRGVLHDRPYLVWFGGLFLILLQLCLPLSAVAAPLLILSDQMPENFGWVPVWIIAFPISVLLLCIFYALVGTRAKCRVCAQRIYVPKQCLKNKKAHRLPLFGYIGALAMHVVTFRWFNCCFCGTSIRIKK